jgi:hypothetical protein
MDLSNPSDFAISCIVGGVFGALSAIESAIVWAVHKLTPNRISETHGKTDKQAIIIDNGHDRAYAGPISLSILLSGFISIFSGWDFLPAGASLFYLFRSTRLDQANLYEMWKSRRLRKALEGKGYSVSIYHKFDGNWDAVLDSVERNATSQTTTVIAYHGHGGRLKRPYSQITCDVYEVTDNTARYRYAYATDPAQRTHISILEKKSVQDYELISKLAHLPGKKVLLVSACQAGGFAAAARDLRGDLRENISVLTASGNSITTPNKLNRAFTHFVKGGDANVGEFFHFHSRRYALSGGRMRRAALLLKNRMYNPQAHVGRNVITI